MQEVFYEESARLVNEKASAIKYNVIKGFSIFSYVVLVLWLILSINFYGLIGIWYIDLLFILIPALIFLSSGIVLGKLKNKMYVEFDYTFVSGDLRISKVIKNIKRRFVIKFDVKNIEKLGFYGNKTFERYTKMPGVNKLFLTSNTYSDIGKDFYYIVVNTQDGKKLLIIECTETLIVNILKFANRTVLDEQFTEQLKNKNKGQKWSI